MRRKDSEVIVIERASETAVAPLSQQQREQVEGLRQSLLGFIEQMGIKSLSDKRLERKRKPLPELTEAQSRAFRVLFEVYKQFRTDIKTDIETYRELVDLSHCTAEDLQRIEAERRKLDA
jgi:hypothetical protein